VAPGNLQSSTIGLKFLGMKYLFIFSLLTMTLASTSKAQVDLGSLLGGQLQSEIATMLLLKDYGLDSNSQPVTVSQNVVRSGNFDQVEVVLDHDHLGPIHLFLSGPHGFLQRQDRGLRSLFITAGFFTGRASIALMGEPAGTVLVGFEYPYQMTDFKRDPGAVLQFLRKTPGQIAVSLKWLSQQGWVNPRQTTAMGASLGGLFLPSALHIAEKIGASTSKTILAFSGAKIGPILENLLKTQVPPDAIHELIHFATNLTAPLDPEKYLPYLTGAFLTIRADLDHVFPLESSQRLEDLLPQPKLSKMVHGGHIDVDQPEVIQQTQAIIAAWLN
jgi:pimeloyl-ACP methyl ester carboxylesterase